MTPEQLKDVLTKHDDWLNSRDGGVRAELQGADLQGADLRDANLWAANLQGANLQGANLRGANLQGADLRDANLQGADLRDANLWAADLRCANLRGANLQGAVLSNAIGVPSALEFLAQLERTDAGYIAYKTFGGEYPTPSYWTIEPGSVITEVCNPDRGTVCACGINLAPIEWVRSSYPVKPIWKCLIRWEWAAGIVVPFGTNGKFRCEKCELVEVVAL